MCMRKIIQIMEWKFVFTLTYISIMLCVIIVVMSVQFIFMLQISLHSLFRLCDCNSGILLLAEHTWKLYWSV
jgi:hypothetical protein